MRIQIKANGRTLYIAELMTLLRCATYGGRAELAPAAAAELTVELELGAEDRVLAAAGLDLQSVGALGPYRRRLEISTPARLPTDELDC